MSVYQLKVNTARYIYPEHISFRSHPSSIIMAAQKQQNRPADIDAHLCPISKEVMEDPVLTPGGDTYERANITAWLNQHHTSPMTRQRVEVNQLIPKRALRDASVASSDSIAIPDQPKPLALVAGADEVKVATVGVGKTVLTAIACNYKTTTIIRVTPTPVLAPQLIIIVLDVSGSMGEEAPMRKDGGKTESIGLSILDIVKHSARVVVDGLRDIDYLAVVSYNHAAITELSITQMNAVGKTAANVAINRLSAGGSTDIWCGLRRGLDLVERFGMIGFNRTIMIMTDGVSNGGPPTGPAATFRQYATMKPEVVKNVIIDTFGFGYQMDSDTMNDIANSGNGLYTFIPDSGFVATAIIDALSTAMSASARNLRMQSSRPTQTLGSIGEIPKYFILDGRHNVKDLSLVYNDFHEDRLIPVTRGEIPEADMLAQTARNFLANVINVVMSDSGDEKLRLDDLRSMLSDPATYSPMSPLLRDILTDLRGQVSEAVITKHFDRWGRHYLPSLRDAHRSQRCNNFKDPGIQHYGTGPEFTKFRAKFNMSFSDIPPPVPTLGQVDGYGGGSFGSGGGSGVVYRGGSFGAAAACAAPVQVSQQQMASYNDSSGPCFAGISPVHMFDGSKRLMSQLRKGDMVSTPHGPARVLCIVLTPVKSANFVPMKGGLIITPWHPVHVDGEWKFPINIPGMRVSEMGAKMLYNVVLETIHCMTIGGVCCITLGHGFKTGAAVHPYFGSTKVIDELRTLPGWDDGVVVLDANNIKKGEDEFVCSMI